MPENDRGPDPGEARPSSANRDGWVLLTACFAAICLLGTLVAVGVAVRYKGEEAGATVRLQEIPSFMLAADTPEDLDALSEAPDASPRPTARYTREALSRLHSDGWVEREEQRSFRVTAISRDELVDVVRTRALIEGVGAAASM